MAKTIIVSGYGTGISKAVAEKFGSQGYQVSLVARSADKLTAAVKEFEGNGVKAAAFPADLSDPAAVTALIGKVRGALGPVSAIHWNAYAQEAGDLMKADLAAIHRAIDVAALNLLIAVQAAHADLKAERGAVLVTNGGFGYVDPGVDGYAVGSSNMGLALANAAKHKLVGLLSARLKADDIYVGEVMVTGGVKGTAWDDGSAKIDAKDIADKFWKLAESRTEIRDKI